MRIPRLGPDHLRPLRPPCKILRFVLVFTNILQRSRVLFQFARTLVHHLVNY